MLVCLRNQPVSFRFAPLRQSSAESIVKFCDCSRLSKKEVQYIVSNVYAHLKDEVEPAIRYFY